MIINWYGEGCFKIQTGGLTLLTDSFDGKTGLTSPRGKFDVILKTLTPWPLPEAEEEAESRVIFGAGEYDVGEIKIRGITISKESTDKYFKTIYLVRAEEINLCFLGHLAEYPESDILDELKEIDVVFVPAGGKPFIDQEAVAKFIKQFNPKIIVPSFFKVDGLKRPSGDLKDFVKELGLKEEAEEKLVLRKKDLADNKNRLVSLKI